MMPRAVIGQLCGALGLALLLGACAGPASAPPPGAVAPPAGAPGGAPGAASAATVPPAPTKFVMGMASLSPQNANIQTMQDAGIFLHHGLEADLQYTGGGANSIAPLVSGEIPIMIGGIPAFVIAQLGGADIAVIAVQHNRFDYFFVANPEIRRPEDLRGKTVSGTRRGALADTALDYLLRYWGFEPLRDVYVAEVNGGEPVRAAALANGAAVGTVMVAPLAREFAEPHYNVLANMSELDIEFATNGLAAPRDRLARDPEFYERFLRAYIEGNHYFRTHPEESARSVLTLLKRDDLEYGQAAYAYYSRLIRDVPTTTPGAMQAVLDTLADTQPRAQTTRPEELLDLRLVERIAASGFVEQIQRN
jgi:ABC-type nitrate/sulfonate/bicarbonate transport system substrate-binding protein